MAFQVSPGVQVKEIDATGVVPAVSTSIGGFAGSFNWGPVDEVITVGSEKNLAEIFGQPTDVNTANYFLTAAGFLKYGRSLKVVRAISGHDNATSGTSGVLIKNSTDYETTHSDGAPAAGNTNTMGGWAAKYPGTLGNSLKVELCGPLGFATWDYRGSFDSAPGTSNYAADVLGKTSALDEVHIAVIDTTGLWSGTPNTVLETFPFVSVGSDAKADDGTTNYYVDVINNRSSYVWWLAHPTIVSSNIGAPIASTAAYAVGTVVQSTPLAGGSDDNAPTVGEISTAYDLLADGETVDVNLLFAYPDASGAVIANKLVAMAAARKDCMAFVSPPVSETAGIAPGTALTNVTTWAATVTKSSYGSADSGALYVYDKYNDKYRWIGGAGHIAGLCAGTDLAADAWFSPAGSTRGQLLGVTKLAFNPNLAQRDELYKAKVNPLVSFPGEGTILFGDKTLSPKPSAFDRINVRRLFIVLEKAISTAAKGQLFEFNDEFTRAQFRNLVEPFLRDVKGRRGVTDFKVICDETNNTGQVIDSNSFVADIFIKPSRSINFITLNFIATRTGVDFSEIAGSN